MIFSLEKLTAKKTKIFFVYVIIALIVILMFGLVLTLSEVRNVGILGNIHGYPWGCKCFDGMEHYLNPQTYTSTLLLVSLREAAIIFTLYWLGSWLYRSAKK